MNNWVKAIPMTVGVIILFHLFGWIAVISLFILMILAEKDNL